MEDINIKYNKYYQTLKDFRHVSSILEEPKFLDDIYL